MNCHPWGPILAQGRQDSSPNPHPLTISRGQSAVGCVVLKYTCWISISPVRRSRKPQYLMQMTTMPPTLLLGKRLKTQEWAKKICQVWATWEVLAECQRKREGQRSPHRWVRSHCYRWTRKEIPNEGTAWGKRRKSWTCGVEKTWGLAQRQAWQPGTLGIWIGHSEPLRDRGFLNWPFVFNNSNRVLCT